MCFLSSAGNNPGSDQFQFSCIKLRKVGSGPTVFTKIRLVSGSPAEITGPFSLPAIKLA